MTTQKEIQTLFDRYEKQMYHIAYQILQDSYLAEDAVLDAFVKILHNAYSFESPDSDPAKRLIIQIIRSSAIDIYRRNQKYREWTVSAEENTEFIESLAIPETEAIFDMDSLISELPDTYQTVIRQRFIYDRPYSEIAQLLGMSESAVRKRQERALKILRRKVKNFL